MTDLNHRESDHSSSGAKPEELERREKLGSRVRFVREEVLKESRSAMAKVMGFSLSTVQYYEIGEREPGYEFLYQLSQRSGCNIAWLMLGTGPIINDDADSPPRSLQPAPNTPLMQQAVAARQLGDLHGFCGRLQQVVDLFGSVKDAAANISSTEDSLAAYLNGERVPSLQMVSELARLQGISLEWIARGSGEKFIKNKPICDNSCSHTTQECIDTLGQPVDLSEFVFIPRYNLKAAAGHGASVAGEAPMFSMSFRRYWIENYLRVDPKDLSVLSVKGDSMEGVLNNKDVILVNHADTAPTSGLYVLRLDEDLIVKRVQKLPGSKLKVLSANEVYEPFVIDMNSPEVDFAVIGRVVWFGRQI